MINTHVTKKPSSSSDPSPTTIPHNDNHIRKEPHNYNWRDSPLSSSSSWCSSISAKTDLDFSLPDLVNLHAPLSPPEPPRDPNRRPPQGNQIWEASQPKSGGSDLVREIGAGTGEERATEPVTVTEEERGGGAVENEGNEVRSKKEWWWRHGHECVTARSWERWRRWQLGFC